ncbi:sensor histidine kinase [Schaedlerella arabinosiphila]|uniref:histidine kinase n=1 Tax=Schaedlerella arabinosiphila TaxID=2044587 RepID=A0A3R8JQJ5_9FIRM|nr:HAMP domain-containing sensor histidine kinase [Schaedlerella arabinosiphila]RRK33899.1 sensor histidine kinase [Schaedlerella arabinosiphila]
MLKPLSKKLNAFFITTIMLIITSIMMILCKNYIHMEQSNEIIFFQKMVTQMIYQLEDSSQDFESIADFYHEYKRPIFCYIQDSSGKMIYQTDSDFPTDADTLLERFRIQTGKEDIFIITNDKKPTTNQSGIFEFHGTRNDEYLGILATIVMPNNTAYHLSLIYRQQSLFDILTKQAFLYVSLWFLSLIAVSIMSHFLIKKALEPTEVMLKSQKDFIASASHELKSPLAVILANAEKLEQLQIDHTEFRKSVNILDNECMRMSKLVKDMLLLASSDAKSWTLCKNIIDIDTLLISLYEAYEPICISKKIRLRLEISESSYPKFCADGERLFQILSIFMDNAIHHSINNEQIEIKTAVTAKHITFFVTDHGRGIPEDVKPYIFNRFYCADESRTDKSNFGLGLSIADELAKMMNGKVGCKDTDGGGATFFVTLPLK